MNSKKTINVKFIEIRNYLIENGFVKNRTDFANRLGSYPTVISDIEKNKRNATFDQLIKLIEKFGDHFNPNYLFGFEEDFNNIIFLTEATAGPSVPTEIQRNFNGFKIPGMFGNLWAFRVKGDSMLPTLGNGDILICEEIEENSKIKNNQIYVVSSLDGINVKRIELQEKDKQVIGMTLKSDNHEKYPPVKVDFSQGLYSSPYLKIYRPVKRITEEGLI